MIKHIAFFVLTFCFLLSPIFSHGQALRTTTYSTKEITELAQVDPAQLARILSQWEDQARQGDETAQAQLGLLLVKGAGVPQDCEKGVSLMIKAAEQGNAIAQFNLGVLSMQGQCLRGDQEQAFHWFKKSAYQGFPEAQINLAIYYAEGISRPSDLEQAIFWLETVVAQGTTGPRPLLASLYLRAENKKALPLLHQLADGEEDGESQMMLGSVYFEGSLVPEDAAKAYFYAAKAAGKGFAGAQFLLGSLYMLGEGVAQNDALAEYWLTKAVAQGVAPAHEMLTRMK